VQLLVAAGVVAVVAVGVTETPAEDAPAEATGPVGAAACGGAARAVPVAGLGSVRGGMGSDTACVVVSGSGAASA